MPLAKALCGVEAVELSGLAVLDVRAIFWRKHWIDADAVVPAFRIMGQRLCHLIDPDDPILIGDSVQKGDHGSVNSRLPCSARGPFGFSLVNSFLAFTRTAL